MRTVRMIALLLALLLTVGFALAEETNRARTGKPAPDFELQTLDGETFKLSEQQGKVVFLNLWATWCPPCREEMPDIQKLAEAHPDDLVVIGVSEDDSAEDVAAFVEENGLTYTFAMDENYELGSRLYATQYIPESVFIDPDGTVTRIEVGILTYAQMEHFYQSALENAGKAE